MDGEALRATVHGVAKSQTRVATHSDSITGLTPRPLLSLHPVSKPFAVQMVAVG